MIFKNEDFENDIWNNGFLTGSNLYAEPEFSQIWSLWDQIFQLRDALVHFFIIKSSQNEFQSTQIEIS